MIDLKLLRENPDAVIATYRDRLFDETAAATARQLSISYGVIPMLAPDVSSTDEMMAQMDHMLVAGGYLKKGELVVFVAGQPVGRPGSTNLMKLHRLGVG